MHKKFLILTTAVLALLALATSAALAARGNAALVVFEPAGLIEQTFLDLGEDGFSVGDTIIELAPLIDPDTGEDVGRAVTRIQIAEVLQPPSDDDPFGDFAFILDCTVELAEGNLTFYGAAVFGDLADGITFTVMGGTGRYARTQGTVTVTAAEVDGQEGATIAFQLTRR